MKSTLRTLLILILMSSFSFAQKGFINGSVLDKSTKTPLEGANITILNTMLGTTTNAQGEFSLTVPADEQTISISYVGYKTMILKIEVQSHKTTKVTAEMTRSVLPLGEVVVTSNKFEKQAKDVSMPLSVVPAKRIEQTAPRDVAQALDSEPGLSLNRDGIWGTNVSIRGLSKNNIVTLVDGNRIDTATDLSAGLSMIDVDDIERIEVVKGAASSLYGTGAVGGVINIITKSGWYDEHLYFKARMLGGYSTVNKSGVGRVSINAGALKWYARISTMLRNAGNTKTPQGILPNSQYADNNVSARVGLRPSLHHEISLNYQRYYAKDVGIPGGYPLFPSIADVRYPQEKRDMFSAEYVGKRFSSTLARISIKYFMQNILRDVENIPHVVKNIPSINGQPGKRIHVLKVTPAATHDTQGIQMQTDWTFGERHYFIAGLDAWQKDLDSHRERYMRIDVLSPADGGVIKSISQVIGERPLPVAFYRSVGAYLQDEMALFKNRLSLTLGGRIDQINAENEQVLNPLYTIVDGTKNNSPSGQDVLWKAIKAHDRSWSGNVGLLFHALKNADLTLNIGKSFRSPYLAERYQYIDLGNLVKIGDPNLKPEKGLFTDVGLRYWNSLFSISANGFYNRMNDLVIESPTTFEGRPAYEKSNVGSAKLYGFDARLNVQFLQNTNVFANIAFVHGEDTFANMPLPLIAPLNGKVGLRGLLGKYFSYELAATIYNKQNRIANWEIETGGYTYFDFYLSTRPVRMESFSSRFFFGLENLTNKSYRNHLATNRGLITAEPGRNLSVTWVIEM